MGETGSTGRSKGQVWLVVAIVLLAVIADQALKLYIATHYTLGESHEITSWFWLCYIENNGMAFGIEWFSKLALTLFRLLAVGLLGWYIHLLIYRDQARTGYIATIAFIIAGALGNIVDCVAYGKLFGYAGWLYGRVVDMFYFPLIEMEWPQWMPFVGGDHFVFFSPVFNFADSCISVSVVWILLFYRQEISRMSFSRVIDKPKDQAEQEE